eukprot:m.338865 g.338865  ORF g.338865 m.338865 type:complete len:335 (-) comp18570_c0_seq1:69-1073(-)
MVSLRDLGLTDRGMRNVRRSKRNTQNRLDDEKQQEPRRNLLRTEKIVGERKLPRADFKPSEGDYDELSGYVLFCNAQENEALRIAAIVANTLVDDPVYIIGLSIGWLGSLLARRLGMISQDSCQPEAWNELYFCFMMWSATESMIKLLTQKRRPAYSDSRNAEVKGVLIPGDQYSFPSGHTLRAFGTARVLFNSPVIVTGLGTNYLLGSAHGNVAAILLWFAAVVGWSRVALGKHSPVDVLGGMALGVIFGDLFWILDSKTRFILQLLCVSYYTFIGFLCLLGVCGAPVWMTGREFWGYKSVTHQLQFIALVCGGTWIFLLGRTSCDAEPMPTL